MHLPTKDIQSWSVKSTPVIMSKSNTNKLNEDFEPAKKLCLKDLNENILNAEYAVRGSIPMKAEKLEVISKSTPGALPFDKIVYASIGNPQLLDQQPLTFIRQVLSLLQYPNLLQAKETLLSSGLYKEDAIQRAETLLSYIGGSVGAYSLAQGVYGIRETIAQFITRRDDGEVSYPDDIFLTDGASKAATYLLSILCRGKETGVLVPIPQYPLYTASIEMYNSTMLPYYLDEESGWSTNAEEIEKTVLESISRGVKPSVIVIINPGNPTGAVLSPNVIAKIFKIAAKYGIVVLADEVYQENIYKTQKFHSMKKILRQLQREFPGFYDNVQLASMHSTSKGVTGECGQRGGYMELVGFTDEVRQVILKLASISICSVVTGQAVMDLMVNPPSPGDASYELDHNERTSIHNNMKERGFALYEMFQKLEGITCQQPQGAMYLFPRLHLPKRVFDEAARKGLKADEFYCHALLDSTGICTVPGSGFGQVPGTFHLRTTFLAPGTEWIDKWESFHKQFFDKYR